MKPGMRMMVLDRLRQSEQQPRSEYGGENGRKMIGYDREGQRSERGRNGPQMGGPERERGYPQMIGPEREREEWPMGGPGRERDYSPMGGPGRERGYPHMGGPGREWGPPMEGPRPGWEYPPMGMGGMYGERYGGESYERGPESRRRRDRRGRYMMGGMEQGEDDEDDKYRLKGGGKMIAGAVWSNDSMPERVDEQKAMEWTRKMRNPDGSTGPHFKPEMAEQLRAAHCPKCDRWEFLVALNMMYADYAEVAKKFGADKPEFYTCMAKAFLEDPDAGEGKLAKYMEIIPE